MISIEAHSLVKKQGSFCLGPLDFTLQAGDRLVVLGKNGSGKSTLFGLLSGSLTATSGTVRPVGETNLKSLGVRFSMQPPLLPQWLRVHEFISYLAYVAGVEERSLREKALEWDLGAFEQHLIVNCSFGTKKRISLFAAFETQPQLLILDEPFVGLDVVQIDLLKRKIRAFPPEHILVFSTHFLEMAEHLSTRVALLSQSGQMNFPKVPQGDATERINFLSEQLGIARA